MKDAYLEVTYRKGQPIAAYYYLPRQDGDRSAQTERADGGLLIDLAPDGRAIGIEITSPSQIDLAVLNDVLRRLGHDPIGKRDLGPLAAA